MNDKSVLVATPMYGGMCCGHYTASLISGLNLLTEQGVKTHLAVVANESLITRARNELVRQFLATDFTHLMFIDSDIYFPGQALVELLKADKDVVCAAYPKKEIDWDRIKLAAKEDKENLADFAGSYVVNIVDPDASTDDAGFIEVRHGGTGFMMIKREVFEKLAEHVPEYRSSTIKDENGEYSYPLVKQFFDTSIDETGCLLSEDFHFCELWRKHGGKIYMQPFWQLMHIGTYAYSGNILQGGANLK